MPADETGERLLHAEVTRLVLAAFFEVYNELGTGYLESVYRTALAKVLSAEQVRVDREVPIDVFFRHEVIGRFYADLVVESRVIVEVKAVRGLVPEHHARLLHFLRSTAMEVGLLLNFGPRPQFRVLSFQTRASADWRRRDPRGPALTRGVVPWLRGAPRSNVGAALTLVHHGAFARNSHV
jgi:GxxExxY protein